MSPADNRRASQNSMAFLASRPIAKGKTSAAPKLQGRSGKGSLVSVDTNISTYDRTDPFFAFNTLRKILGALPSRIGGCGFKLTPEEHKLSMHLLTIVEPFVGLSPSRRTLTLIPNEILDSIVFYLDSKRDLVALALSCRRMYGVIFPRHHAYRVIRCKVSSISVWNHLIVNRCLARNIRRLEILDERSTVLQLTPPGIMASETDLESTDDELGMHAKQERYLVAALNKMTALRSFAWACNHSPISIDNVWPSLLKCGSLQEVDISDNLIFGALPSIEGEGSSSSSAAATANHKRALRDLTSVALRSTKHVYGTSKNPSLSRVSKLLDNCPNLESLNIGYETRRGPGYAYPNASDLFLCSRWPALRTLSLTNLHCPSALGLDAAATFLFAHLNIEVLHLDLGDAPSAGRPQLVLPPDALPKLKELRANNALAAAVLSCPSSTPRPLETLRGVRLSGGAWDAALLASLRVSGASVRRVELAGWNEVEDVKRLAECVPGVSWLDVGKSLKAGRAAGSATNSTSTHKTRDSGGGPVNVGEWAGVLGAMPELTTFHGVKFFYEVSALAMSYSTANLPASEMSRVRKNESIAGVLAGRGWG
ncbi:hypothetical protein FIBSPDRAFT_1054303 [Athelia psychrophila]|uniref:F-box domain-containing protein n=1 Tax=Athelia psychrophila TaxID=1759441 RepID=A0A167VJH5_9AGAM|nr:hypothetical protein FIBSPDRAFT_1054303 [Fibularhizoctonia sp. CBS 109695]